MCLTRSRYLLQFQRISKTLFTKPSFPFHCFRKRTMFSGWECGAVVLVDCTTPWVWPWALGIGVHTCNPSTWEKDRIKVISSYRASLRPATDTWDSNSKKERKTTFQGSKVSEGWALSIMHCREYQSVGRKKSLLKIEGKKENPLRFQLMKTMFRTLKRGWRVARMLRALAWDPVLPSSGTQASIQAKHCVFCIHNK